MQIDHGKAEGSVFEGVDDAFLDRGNVVPRHDTAGDLVFERETRAARHRLDVDHDIAVLAVAAGLFLVPAALHHALPDGLAVANRRLAPLPRHAIAIAEPFGGDAQVHFALAPQHHFVRLRIVHDDDRRIFLGELVERLAELDVVLALFCRNRDRQHRRGRLDLGDRRVRLFAGAERVAGLGLVELGKADGIADRRRAALLARLTGEFEHAGATTGLLVAGHENRTVAGLAGEHADDRHLAAVRGVLGLEHIADGGGTRRLDAEPLRRLGDAG